MSDRGLRKIMEGTPRAFHLIDSEKSLPPLGMPVMRPSVAADRARPLAEAVARGDIPLDDQTSNILSEVMLRDYRKMMREMKGANKDG